MNGRWLNLFLVIFLLGSVGIAAAAEPAWDCEGCSQAQYDARALSAAQEQGLHGQLVHVLVYDISGNHLLKYQVGGEPGAGGTWLYEVTLVSTTSDEQDAFNVQRTAIEGNAGGVIWFGHVNSSQQGFPYPTQSAFNVVLTPAYVTGMSNWILLDGSSNVWLNDLGLTANALANAVAGIFLKSDIVSMQITVTFTDGSYVVLTWHAGTSEMVMTAAKDVNNNIIPVPPNEPTQHFVFPNGGSTSFGNYMNSNYGTNLPNVPVCRNGYLACSHVVGTGVYGCTWINCENP